MRRGWEAVGWIGLACLMLATTEPSVRKGLYGPDWLSPVLFAIAGFFCFVVLVFPDSSLARAVSGLCVSAAFAWRAVSTFVADVFYHGDRPIFAVVLYLAVAGYISLTWHRIIPAPEPVRRRIREFSGDV